MEKKYEELFGGLRVGTLGKEDVFHHIYSVECKEMQDDKGMKKLTGFWEQCTGNAKDKVPILAMHFLGTRYEDDLIVMRASDFKERILK
jgi:hypothetical protein